MTLRIVSLCPSVTELVCDLGAASELVGVTRFCHHPADVVASIEKVGGTKDPDVARIVALRPDVVLMNEEENRLEDAEALTAAGVRVQSDLPRTASETAAMVRRVGQSIGRAPAADAIARDIETRSARVASAVAGRPVVSWCYLIWRKPWMAAAGDTFIDALLTQAGGRNVFGDRTERYPAVTAEELIDASPDTVLLATEPFPFAAKHVEELVGLTGWPAERFQIVDGEDLSWHGSRTPRGVDYAFDVLEAVRSSAAGSGCA